MLVPPNLTFADTYIPRATVLILQFTCCFIQLAFTLLGRHRLSVFHDSFAFSHRCHLFAVISPFSSFASDPEFWVFDSGVNSMLTSDTPLSLGMPEMLKPTSLIMGAGLGLDVACLTDGRFSGG